MEIIDRRNKMTDAEWAEKLLQTTRKMTIEEICSEMYCHPTSMPYGTKEEIIRQVRETLRKCEDDRTHKFNLLLPYILIFYTPNSKETEDNSVSFTIKKALLDINLLSEELIADMNV
jgi:hypothetical protein